MGKTKIFKVTNNKIQFRCTECTAKRNLTIPQNIRRKNIKCHGCGELVKCVFNRRHTIRESLSGKIIATTHSGNDLDVDLYDLSQNGIGIDMPVKTARLNRLAIGNTIRFRCAWNPKMLPACNYIVKNIKGQRIGAQKIA